MRTNVLNDLSNVVKKGTSLACSCAAGSTMSAECPGNHPVITQLSPRNHPLLDVIWKHVAMIFAVLMMSIANIGMAWGVDITVTRFALNGTTIYAINESNKMFHDEVEFSLSTTPSLSSNKLTVPASSVLTIGAHGKTITKIVIEWNAANNSSTFSTGTATWKNSNKTMTWTGSTTSLAITSGAASRVNSAVITYTDADPLSGVTTTTLSSFSRIYSSSGACMYSSKTNSAYGVNIQGALDSNNPVGLSKNASNSLFTNGLRLVSPKPISSVVYTWTVAPTAASVSSGTYNSSTSTWTAANTTTTEVTIYNNGTGTAKFSQIVVNFVGSTPECEDVDAPTSLSCTAHTQTSLTFGWTKASNASGYVAKLWDNSSCTGDAVATENIANGNTETVTFSGLTAGTTYYCKVQSKGDGTDFCEDGGTTSAANGTTDACTAISPTWSYPFSTVAVGITIYPTIGGNTGGGAVTYSSSATGKITNDCYATAAGSATLTANVAANGVYCSGSVTSGTITVVSDQSGLIKQTLTTGNNEWGTPSAPTTTDETNITSTTVLSATNLTISGNGNTSNGGQTAKITGMTADSEGDNSSKYMQMGFTVKSGKQLNVSAIYIPVQPVSSDVNNIKAVLTDGETTITGTLTNSKNGKLAYIKFDSYGTVKGNVTLTLYAWGWTGGYRLGKSIVIDGEIEDAPSSCTAPSSVGISGEWRYFPGQTISLTATPTGGVGTPAYQWQKEVSADAWENISNGGNISGATSNNLQISSCGTGNTGKYRCVVSTGATCSTNSDPFSVKIFTLNGAYDDGEFSSNNITFTSGTTGTATVHLAAGRVYKFKVTDNFGMWFGNSGRILEPASSWTFPSNNSTNCVLFTGPEGDYTFTVDIDHVTYGTPEVVVSVAYPDVTHPSAGYAYFRNVDNWTNVGLYMWYEGGGSYTDWGSEPWVTRTTTICGNTYYYTPLIPSWYNRAIFREVGGSGQTGNIEYANLAAYSGKYNDKSDANWHEFTTYTISFAGNGNTGGSMSAIEGICPNSNQEITANAFEKTGYTFNCWHADKAVQVGGSTIPAGGDIAGGATLQEINSDLTLTAQWTVKTTTITLDKNNSDASGSTSGSATVTYGSDELATYTAATRTGYTISSYKTETSGGYIIIKNNGSLNSGNKGDILDDGHWSYDGTALTLYAQWEANKFDVTHTLSHVTRSSGGEAGSNKATYGTAYSVTFAASSGYTLPAAVTVTVGGSNVTANCTWNQGTGTLTIPAAYVTGAIVITVTGEEAVFDASSSINIEKWVLDNRKDLSGLQTALTSAHILYDFSSGCSLDSLDDNCSKTNRNEAYLGLKIKSSGKYVQINLPSGSGLKVKFGNMAAAVNLWIDGVAQTDIPTSVTDKTYVLASSGSNRVVKLATSTGDAVVIKQIMIGEDIQSVTLPAKITLGSPEHGTISVASAKVNVGSTVTVTATPASGYVLETLTYTPACPNDASPENIDKATKQFTMPNGNVTINATFVVSCSAHDLAYATASVAKNVGDAAFTNPLTNPNSLSVTYSSSNISAATVNATSGMVTIVGAGSTVITATWAGNATYCAGTATYTLTVSSGCTPQSLSKVSATKGTSGTVTGYNDGQYAGDAVVNLYSKSPQSASLSGVGSVDGYKMGDAGTSIVFATLKGTSFQVGDKVRIGITRRNDMRQVDSKYNILTIYYGTSKSDAAALTTITTGGDNDNSAEGSEGAGFYEYTLTLADVTAIGSKKGIGLFRESSNGENPYVYSVEIIGCREWATCEAPDAVAAGSVTATGATFTITDAENTNNYEIYYSTSSTAPTAETSATVSGISSKSRAVTGLTDETTYYYWVRSNCGGVTKSAWVAGTPATFTTTAAASTYRVTYNGNSNTSGSVPTDATAYEEGDIVTVKGNTGSLVKTDQTFLGWSTSATASSGTFYPAGYKFEMPAAAVNLYAVWGSTGATCVTITDFETNSYSKSSNKPDSEGYYFYGYKGTKDAAHAVTITTPSSETRGSNKGADMMIRQNTSFSIYADNTTTGGTPQTFSNVTSVSFKIKAVKDTRIPTIDVFVGSTKIETVTGGSESSDTDGHEYDTSGFTTITVSDLSNLAGIVKFVNTSSGSSDYKALFDDIQICYGSGAASGFTVSFNMNGHGSAIADIENVPDGSKISAPIPSPTAVGVEFGGWYNEAGCSSVWNFATGTITANKTLYAKWTTCEPTISAHPEAATYTQGDDATALSVTASGEGLNYQWYTSEDAGADISGSSAIPGATSASYTPSTSLLGTIYYFCVVSNTCGNAISNKAAITVNDSKPAPTANWTIEEPKEGGKGFTFSIEVNKNNGNNWDGELIASMLTLSDNAILDGASIVVNNTNKTISGTYGVKAGSSSPVTFYLLLPATATQSATRLDHDRAFNPCAGGAGDSYNVRVRKDYEKDASNNYRWVTPGAGEITYAVNSSISSAKASSAVGEFDSIMSNDKQYVWVKTYEANTKTIRLHVETSGANISVNALYKNTVYATAADKDIVSSDDYSVSYDGSGSAENTGTKGTHYMDITFDSPLAANDIICVKFSSSKVKAYGAVLTTVGDGGDQTTGLTWSNSQASGATVEKQEDAADFTITAVRDATALKSLGLISYTSSNTAIATVNASTGLVHIADNIDFGSDEFKTTTITATLAASGCYKKASITYTLRVNKYVCADTPGTITYVDNGCSGMVLTLEGYEAGATVQWYNDGSPVGTNSATYNATEPGEYYAVSDKNCDITSTNSVKLERAAATAEKIVDSWYVKNGRRTPDIALVQTTGATSFTVTSGGTITEIGGCTFELKDDGIIYLHGQKDDGSAPSDMTPGDMTITITVSGCVDELDGLDITLHIQAETAKPSVAFVVDGTLRKDGGTATSVSADKTSNRPLWTYLSSSYALTGCNAYWSVDSKELRQYYSQFDAILITDDPSTDTKGTGGVSYVKAFGTMVDVRPVLTMEAFVGKFKDGGWHVYDATPTSPNPRQVEMKLECKNHDIFKGLDPETSDNVRTTTDEHGNEHWHVIMVDTTVAPYHNTSKDYKDLPALQGFDPHKFDHMLGVGTIAEETLQGGVERQEEPAARMMILGVQNEAMAALTNEGKLIIKNAIEYLLKTNMEDVNDCSNYFTDETGNGLWNDAGNWTSNKVPDFESRVRILKPVVVPNEYHAIVARVDIATSGKSKWIDGTCNGSVTINPQGALTVGGKIRRADAPHYGIDDLMPTENDDLIVKAATTSPHYQGALIFDNSDGDTRAVVEMWNPSHWDVVDGKKKKYWSYVAVPIQEADIPNFFWYGFTYLYDETSGWIKKSDGTSLYPFQGIGASLQDGNMETFYGPLATTESQDITLTYTADKGQGMNLIGNSWTAPIQIANFEEDDFGDAAAEVWVFNTGNKNDGTPGSGSSATPGQWNTIPINAPSLPGYEGLKVIPAMQAFEVNTTSETTLHLDYDRLVRAGRENLNEPMRAPRRGSAAKQIEATMRVRVSGELTHTDVYLLKDARFSDAFDNGWDGHYLSGDDRSAQLYAISEAEGELAFLAQPEIEGTQLGFAPSKKDTEYTFSFSYDGEEPLYLNDLKLKESTLIDAENTYLFTYEEGDAVNRFYISATPFEKPNIATGTETIGHPEKVQKVMYKDHIYIIRGGKVFDVVGKMVK